MFIDTHCHLDFEDFNQDRDEVISLALESGVRYLINVGSSFKASQNSIALA
ncbi:MAG: TatD family hydrolase, partial [Candidatus Omnitrophica bacterium]|nr:TatD family hydrolase [Candidatus Omnitrophota bacterium]